MADVNGNESQARTGGPANATTGAPDQTLQPDSQKGSAANAIGDNEDTRESGAPDVEQGGGKQPTDPVQND